MTRRVLRYEVPVDDAWHRITYAGLVEYVFSRDAAKVEFWSLEPPLLEGATRTEEFRVFGTGQPIEDELATYVGSAVTAGGALVWHLFRRGVRG